MSDIPVWSCEFVLLKGPGAADLNAITVGAKFGMKCHGDLAVNWDQTRPSLTFAKPEDAYSLALLQVVEQKPNDIQYVVTAYKAGDHKPEYLRVLQSPGTAGERGFEFSKPTWKVESVLDPKQQPQAYGPFGPWSIALPMWFLLSAALVLLLVAWFAIRRFRKYTQRRRMLENLKRHTTAVPPLFQYYRDARQLRRRLHNVKDAQELKPISEDLDREFRLYVLRRFQIPTLDWSNRAILEDLRRRHRRTYRSAGVPLRKTLRELGKLKARSEIKLADLEQLYTMSLDAAEKLDATPTGGRA